MTELVILISLGLVLVSGLLDSASLLEEALFSGFELSALVFSAPLAGWACDLTTLSVGSGVAFSTSISLPDLTAASRVFYFKNSQRNYYYIFCME